MTQSASPQDPTRDSAGEEEAHVPTDEPLGNTGETPCQHQGHPKGAALGIAGMEEQTPEQQQTISLTLQALLGVYASQPNEATQREESILQHAQDQMNQREPANPWEGTQRPANHPMSSQCTIHPTTLQIQRPLGDTEECLTATAGTDNLVTKGVQEAHTHRDTSVEQGHVDYLMAGSDDELVNLRRESAQGMPGDPASQHAGDNDDDSDDDEPDPETGDEERTTSLPSLFYGGKHALLQAAGC